MRITLPNASRVARLAPFVLLAACAADAPTSPETAAFARTGEPGTHIQYGAPRQLGGGMVRTYVLLDALNGQAPLELGVALDAKALQDLGSTQRMLELALPAKAPAPYQFVMLDWNPAGHQPPGVYTYPHFDFHFYMVPSGDVMAIDPADPNYAANANNVPTGGYVPQYYIVPAPPGTQPADSAVPFMGLHWSDVRSPELQNLLGNPAGYQQFTKTFIYGSWAGQFTFLEPMITLAYLQSVSDQVTTPISTPLLVAQEGWYPGTYRITYDAQRREYRVALADLAWRAAN